MMLKEISTTPTKRELKRFFAKVEINPNTACWEWTANKKQNGYGVLWMNRGGRRGLYCAHRLIFAWVFGDPGKSIVCHKCDNPPCVNPLHLFAGSHSDNQRDQIVKGRHPWARRTMCSRGHPYPPNAKIRKAGGRECASCQEAHWRQKNAKRSALRAAARIARSNNA